MNGKFINKNRSDCIIAWVQGHILISKSALCAKVGYEYEDFRKVEAGKMTIAAKFLDAFEQTLKDYGYLPPVS